MNLPYGRTIVRGPVLACQAHSLGWGRFDRAEVLDILVQERRNGAAATRLFKRLLSATESW